jgi:large subunit ribosomal protein L4
MMKVKVFQLDGKAGQATADLDQDVFAREPNDHAIYQAVRLEEANRRQGTHMSKNRALVSGGGRKPFRQKGTGRARQGTIRAPQMRGGGRVFGPTHVRDYGFRLPKKVRRLARLSALSYKAANDAIIVVEDFTLADRKTARLAEIIRAFDLEGKKPLFITPGLDRNLVAAANNLYGTAVRSGIQFSTRDVMYAGVLVIQQSALAVLKEGLVS